jgi:hypothetical protein
MFSFLKRASYYSRRSVSNYPVLGRWTLNQTDMLIHRKIDLANEDHCGCCFPTDEHKLDEKHDETFFICGDDVVCVSDKF